MAGAMYMRRLFLQVIIGVLAGLLLFPAAVLAQEEVASALRRYKERELSTGYYEEYEVLPRRQRPFVSIPGVRRGIFSYSPTAAEIRVRTRLADSHRAIKFYERRRCEDCHIKETKDIHTVRGNLTCRQCHGGEPIASSQHFFSPMNPIRKHAYVCAKCHQGATASYASYIVHEPPAGARETQKSFPLLYYAYWLMVFLLAGTLVFFIPHSLMVGLRELVNLRKKRKGGK